MRWPWTDKTGIAKGLIVFATMLLVAMGLCGAQYGSLFLTRTDLGPVVGILMITGGIELAVMAISALMILVLGVAGIVRMLRER